MMQPLLNAIKTFSPYSILSIIGLSLGFARELIVASKFGLSQDLDVFVAMMGVHLFFGVQLGNVLESAFISKVAPRARHDNLHEYLAPALRGLLLLNLIVIILTFVGIDSFLNAVFPDFNAHQHALALKIINVWLLTILLANTAGLLRGALALLGVFAPGFLAGPIISICSIVAMTMLSDRYGIYALVLGFAVGNCFVLAYFILQATRHQSTAIRMILWGTPTKKMFYLWGAGGSIFLGEMFYQGIAMTERSFGSSLQSGTIAAFFYASTVVMVPVSLVVIPFTTTHFPNLVKAFSNDRDHAMTMVTKYATVLFCASFIVVAMVLFFSEPIIELLFVRGKFTPQDAAVTAGILSILVWALPFLSIGRLVRNSLFSIGDYRTPIYANACQWITLLFMSSAFVPPYGVKGLAFSSLAAQVINPVIMLFSLNWRLRSARVAESGA